MQSLTDNEKASIINEVKDQFDQLISAVNGIDTASWASFYSDDSPVSAVAGVDFYGDKKVWAATIENYFSQRKSQSVEPIAVRVTPLAIDLALLVSEEKSTIALKDGGNVVRSKHTFTMIWKKEKKGWKILHSHESWQDL